MSDATHAEKMVAKLEEQLLATVGVQSVTVDGQSTTFVKNLKEELAYWKRQVAIEQGTNPRAATINLSNAH